MSNGKNQKSKSHKHSQSIFQLFHTTNTEQKQSLSTTHVPKNTQNTHTTHKRSQSTVSQFGRLKSAVSSVFPKKSIRVKPKPKTSLKHRTKPKSSSKNPKKRKERARSFSFRRKKNKKNRHSNGDTFPKTPKKSKSKNRKSVINLKPNSKSISQLSQSQTNEICANHHHKTVSCQINTCYDWSNEMKENSPFQTPNTLSMHPTLSSTNLLLSDVIVEEEFDQYKSDKSDTEEYKGYDYEAHYQSSNDSLPMSKPKLSFGPRSHSTMRSFEKRPEYITYYPPASLMGIFSNITVDEEERSVTVETKNGIKKRIDDVDQLFELAEMTLDYSNFYGYNENEQTHKSSINTETETDTNTTNTNPNTVININEIDFNIVNNTMSEEYEYNINVHNLGFNYIITDEYQLNSPSLNAESPMDRSIQLCSLPDDDEDTDYNEYNMSWQ